MSDQLTPAEIAAIKAFPKRRIQRVPQGVSGETPWVWDEKSGGLRDPSGVKWTPWGTRKRQLSPSNGQIVSMWRGGETASAIATKLGLSRDAVKTRIKKMRAKGVVLPMRKMDLG
jgi:DNA-binding NarL/FixJ family response regulator